MNKSSLRAGTATLLSTLLFIIFLVFPSFTMAVPLTDSQKAIVHADMIANPALATYISVGDDTALANYYNATAVPDYIVWKSSVRKDEILLSTTFDWTRVDNLTTGKSRIWDMMFDNTAKTINPGNSNIRAGIDATWVGTAADLAVRASVYEKCKRPATLLEKLFAIGSGTTVSPSILAYEGKISPAEISEARSWQ